MGKTVTDENAKDITRVEELSYDLRVGEVMAEAMYTATPEMLMSDLLTLLRTKRISGLPVVVNGALVGVISMEDLIRALVANDIQAPINKYMTTNVITIHDFDPVIEAIEKFTNSHVGRMPVVDESGKLIGMITKGDITRGVLIALQKDYQAEEVRRYRASHLFEDIKSDRTSLILRYNIKKGDFTHGGSASSAIKRALLRLGANPQLARRCGIAIYEAEMNLIIHTTQGGMIRVEIEPHRILMRTTDEGPGIAEVSKALTAGWSTATNEIRELGFGAGMGLPNIQRCVDEMKLTSELGRGTRLEMIINLQADEALRESSQFENYAKGN